MADVLRHRGPDDGGIHVDRGERVSAGLAHRRLSIIDLSANGHQPMTNEDGSLWLTYNGEIYNHAELRDELLRAGHRYRSGSDAETVLHAYEQWGDECVQRFRGMFAFGLWDSQRRRLLLARDRLGVKPLYYAILGTTLVFASEVKAILAGGWLTPVPALGALAEHLMFGYLAGEDTLFQQVRKLMPGHVLVWDGAATVRRYWDVRFTPDTTSSETELVERCRALLEESIRMHLMSDVPIGVFLSGGIDSSAIAAIAARHLSGRLQAFSIGFETPHYSELPFAREVAHHVGADHHEVVLTAEDFLTSVPRMIWHEDEPLWDTPSVALYHLAAQAARSVKVVLTGEGSDELFAGYDRYWMTKWNTRAGRVYRYVPRALRGWLRRTAVEGALPERVRRALGHTVLNRDPTTESMIFDNWFGVFTPEARRRIGTGALAASVEATDVYAAHRAFYDAASSGDLVDRMLYTDLKGNLVELLMKQDQMTMAASVESRVPFLDPALVEFAATVPSTLKLRGPSGKHVLKRALANYLPRQVLYRPKQGFPVPFEAWLRERFLPDVSAVLTDTVARRRGWFDTEQVAEVLAAHRAGARNATREIWCLATLELWARIFLDGDRTWVDSPADAWSAMTARRIA